MTLETQPSGARTCFGNPVVELHIRNSYTSLTQLHEVASEAIELGADPLSAAARIRAQEFLPLVRTIERLLEHFD